MPDDFRGRITHSFGFRTDRATRPNLVAILVKEVRDHPENFVDRETLLQMITFVRNDRNRAEAAEGAHDDCVDACSQGLGYLIFSPGIVAAPEADDAYGSRAIAAQEQERYLDGSLYDVYATPEFEVY